MNSQTRPTALGGLGIVLTSIAVSISTYGLLGETVRIRWTIGTYPQYGPQHAPTILVLATFPVLLVGLYLGSRALGAYLTRTQDLQDLEAGRTIIDICTLLLLGIGLVSQLGLILLNL